MSLFRRIRSVFSAALLLNHRYMIVLPFFFCPLSFSGVICPQNEEGSFIAATIPPRARLPITTVADSTRWCLQMISSALCSAAPRKIAGRRVRLSNCHFQASPLYFFVSAVANFRRGCRIRGLFEVGVFEYRKYDFFSFCRHPRVGGSSKVGTYRPNP